MGKWEKVGNYLRKLECGIIWTFIIVLRPELQFCWLSKFENFVKSLFGNLFDIILFCLEHILWKKYRSCCSTFVSSQTSSSVLVCQEWQFFSKWLYMSYVNFKPTCFWAIKILLFYVWVYGWFIWVENPGIWKVN